MFIGRESELGRLDDLFKKKTSSLVVCHGRRRIGKSTLIEVFGKKRDRFLEFQGLAPQPGLTRKDQLDNFCTQLSAQTALPRISVDSWDAAFRLLASQQHENEETVVLFDEISWMALNDKTFSGSLKISWDTVLKKFPRLVLVLCGSVSSWIDKNILNNTGFLGRVSLDLPLAPLPLRWCNSFFPHKGGHISSLEKLKVLAVTGGVPRYLEEIDMRLSADENIRRLCFTRQGMLFNEFDHIFSGIFNRRNVIYKRILAALIEEKGDLGSIAETLERDRSGDLSEYCDDLEKSGFIIKEPQLKLSGKQSPKFNKFRIQDNYIRFYLRYIEPRKAAITNDILRDTPLDRIIQWDSILGLQFETLVLNNLPSVLSLLKIDPASVRQIGPYFQTRTLRQEACQIDLLVICAHSLYVCEIKHGPRLGVELIGEIESKIKKLKIPSGVSCRSVLIYEGSLSKELESAGYFHSFVSFGEMLAD